MRIPSKVLVAGRPYDVKIGDLGQDTLGETTFMNRTISLSPQLTQSRAYEVFIHELVHATLYETGTANCLTDRQTEAVCDAIALVFSEIMDIRIKQGESRERTSRNDANSKNAGRNRPARARSVGDKAQSRRSS